MLLQVKHADTTRLQIKTSQGDTMPAMIRALLIAVTLLCTPLWGAVSTTINQIQYVGAGSAGPFAVPFPFVAAADLRVITTDLNGNSTTLSYPSAYSVAGGAVVGSTIPQPGSVTLTNPLTTGYGLYIDRGNMLPTQPLTLANGAAFPSQSVAAAFDRITLLLQQSLGVGSRYISLPPSDPQPSVQPTLPGVAARANNYLGFDSSGNMIAIAANNASGTSVVATGSSTARLLSDRFAACVDARDFGAVGNGLTDDHVAIQTAINAVSAAGGGAVTFGNASLVYHVMSSISVPANIRLIGNGAKLLCLDSDALQDILSITGSGAQIIGLTIEHDRASSNAVCVDVQSSVTDLMVTNCTLQSTSGNVAIGINVNAMGVGRLRVENCRFIAMTYGILVNSTASNFDGLVAVGNTFTGSYGDDIEINTPSGAYAGAKNILVSGNRFNPSAGSAITSGFGVGVAGASFVSITGNTITGSRYQGVHMEAACRSVSITGNTIAGGTASPTGLLNSGIYIIDGQDITITGNNCYGWYDHGIHCDYDSTHNAANITIGNNVCNGNTLDGIRIGTNGGVQAATITGNVLASNGGNGITLLGGGTDYVLKNNIASANTGYGVQILGPSTQGVEWSGNHLVGNIAGKLDVSANLAPLIIESDSNFYVGTIASNATPATNSIYLGKAASGTLTISVRQAGSAWIATMWTLTWDGTTLTLTLVKSQASGTATIITPAMSGNWLQTATAQTITNGTQHNIDVQFIGHIMLK